MIGRWLVRRREAAINELLDARRFSIGPTPRLRRARRRLTRADSALDLWTFRGRR